MKKSKISSFGLLFVLVLGLILATTNTQAQVKRGAGVPVEALPKELKGLDIKDYFVPTSLKKVGVIHALTGNVVVIHRDTKEAYFGREGDYIHENDSLNTLADSRCRIKFFDDDVITMAENTEFSVESFQDQRKERKKSSLFSMLKGKTMFYAMRLFRYKEIRFNLKTPTAVVGVRGTKFGAHVYWLEEEKRSDAGIRVADSGKDVGMYLAQVGPGPAGTSYTDAFCVDGFIDVAGVPVGPGEMFLGRTRQVIPTPPEVLRAFERVTTVKTEEEMVEEEEKEKKKEAEEEVEEAVAAETGEEATPETFTEIIETVTETTHEETGTQTESTEAVVQERPRTHYGYFSGMLIDTTYTDYIDDVFVSESRQNFDSDSVRAEGLVYPSANDYIEARGGSPVYQDPYAKRAVWMNETRDSGELGTNYPIDDVELGHNSYQEWGYWTMTKEFTVSDSQYYFDNKGYYIYGDYTETRPTSGSYSYSGDAWGTFFTSDTGADMTGTFSASIDFAASSNQISNFTVDVSGGGHTAKIQNATGSFGSSQFTIDKDTGTWQVDGYNASYKGAHGSLYGPSGQYIGGAWGMYYSSSYGAAGIFQGGR